MDTNNPTRSHEFGLFTEVCLNCGLPRYIVVDADVACGGVTSAFRNARQMKSYLDTLASKDRR